MAGSAKDVQAFFERVATDWDTMRLAYYDERVIEKMAEVGSIDEGSEIADVGTGTGFVAAGLAPRVKRVIGIDNASAMLRVARENLNALSKGAGPSGPAPSYVARPGDATSPGSWGCLSLRVVCFGWRREQRSPPYDPPPFSVSGDPQLGG